MDGMRTGDIVNRTRALIKKAPQQREGLDINAVALEAIDLTNDELVMNSVSVQMKLAKDLPLVQGDRVQLLQVMVNLIVNAIEAMSPHAAGARDLPSPHQQNQAQEACSSLCVTLVRARTPRISSASSSPIVWERACRSAARSSRRMGEILIGHPGRGPRHHLAVYLTGGHGQRTVS